MSIKNLFVYLPDGTVSDLENLTETKINTAYIKAQSEAFSNFVHDCVKILKKDKLEDKNKE